LRYLLPEDFAVEHTIDNGEVVLTSLQAPAEAVGKSSMEFDKEGMRRVVAVSRFGVPRIPNAELTIQEGDILHISCARGHASKMPDELRDVGNSE
jgi:Trk K+ transport system NAD-binding subunit